MFSFQCIGSATSDYYVTDTLMCTDKYVHVTTLVPVPGDVLLATAFLSYSGPFNQEFRNLLLNDWQRELKQRYIPFGNNLNLTELLIDAPTVSEWNLQVSDLFC